MFEKIGKVAERLAANVSESRRGFLARVGQAALGVAGVFAGLLALPAEAQAQGSVSRCEVQRTYGGGLLTGRCVCNNPCRFSYTRQCPGGAVVRSGFLSICNTQASLAHPCTCH
jgi:hypothetical protein